MNMEEKQEIPEWLLKNENYEAEPDHDGFLEKSLLRILAVLAGFRRRASLSPYQGAAAPRLLLVFLLILLVSLSRNALYLYTVLAVFLLRIALLPLSMLRRIMQSAFTAGLFSALLMLPAVFLGAPRSMVTLALKVFFSAGLLALLSETTAWNRLAAGFRMLRLPSLFILTFELTLRSIVLLGEIAGEMLTAMTLRSVGKNRQKHKSFSGIPGTAFLRARVLSEQVYEGMLCRGFDGEYRYVSGEKLSRRDIPVLLLGLAALLLFLRVGL